jgi:hypothetical protein
LTSALQNLGYRSLYAIIEINTRKYPAEYREGDAFENGIQAFGLKVVGITGENQNPGHTGIFSDLVDSPLQSG